MHHYFEAITNTSGDSLVGYFARVIDPATQNTVTMSADDNGTPIVTKSGVENMGSTDDYGNLDFYVVPGTYHLDIYAPNATSFIFRVPNVAMNSSKGDTGAVGPQGDPGNGLSDQFVPAGAGATPRSGTEKLRDTVALRDYGADPTGVTGSALAFDRALAAGNTVTGTPGDVYLLERQVACPNDRKIIGNGASLKIAASGIGLRFPSTNRIKVSGWTIVGNGGLYAVLNEGRFNEFSDNICTGNVGHYFFSTGATNVVARGNKIDGITADTEISTAIIAENSAGVSISQNEFTNIMTGWAVQLRNVVNYRVSDNTFFQQQYSDTKTATAGQTVFNFTLASKVLVELESGKPKVRIQLNGKPLSPTTPNPGNPDSPNVIYTISGTGPNYTITFTNGRTAGDSVKLVGYRGAENIQANNNSREGVVQGNVIDGGADAGIIMLGGSGVVCANKIKNVGFAGIAIYGGTDKIVVSGNLVTDCAQMDDGLSSPDNFRLSSPFNGALFVAGENIVISGNQFVNDSGTMGYAINIQKTDMALRTDGSSAITIGNNQYSGTYTLGRIYCPNQTSGQRVNSVSVDGPIVNYPAQIDLDQAWTNAPPTTPYFATSGFGGTIAVRDTTVKMGGTASLKTVAGEYVDFNILSSAMFRNSVVTLSFWAKAATGRSYAQLFTTLAGLQFPLTVSITDTAWRQYTISMPLTAALEDSMFLRLGGDSGGSANFQYIQISARRL